VGFCRSISVLRLSKKLLYAGFNFTAPPMARVRIILSDRAENSSGKCTVAIRLAVCFHGTSTRSVRVPKIFAKPLETGKQQN
jgi:hypothetical protein